MKIPRLGDIEIKHTPADGDEEVEVLLKDGWTAKRIAYVVVLLTLAILFIVRFSDVVHLVSVVVGVLMPVFAGAVVAYLVNLIMFRLEKVYFPDSTNRFVEKSRRVVCMILSFAIVALVFVGVGFMVSGQVADSFKALIDGITAAFTVVSEFIRDLGIDESALAMLGNPEITKWEDLLTKAIEGIGGIDGILTSALGLGGVLTASVVDAFFAFIFSLYFLLRKEHVMAGAHTLGRTLLSDKWYARACHACAVANDCFSRFITGQCVEAMILGTLCALGMTIMGIPYAGSIGVVVGLFSLVPLVGAWVGGIIGVLMILPISFQQALIFAVFLLILQQVEGNLIYPRTVGTAVGVSAIWVLAAVFVGGALFNVAGILLGVPVVATVGRLLEDFWKRPESVPAAPGVASGPNAPAAPTEPSASVSPAASTAADGDEA
ncbi:MAG: AI-2E family transporter [Eggerthellaceae bacterium]|nr:AI-2E family transporter [Eggerthellaceae bacterium]